nr:hypothetical protein CFP56_56964 [Quercus suber]
MIQPRSAYVVLPPCFATVVPTVPLRFWYLDMYRLPNCRSPPGRFSHHKTPLSTEQATQKITATGAEIVPQRHLMLRVCFLVEILLIQLASRYLRRHLPLGFSGCNGANVTDFMDMIPLLRPCAHIDLAELRRQIVHMPAMAVIVSDVDAACRGLQEKSLMLLAFGEAATVRVFALPHSLIRTLASTMERPRRRRSRQIRRGNADNAGTNMW